MKQALLQPDTPMIEHKKIVRRWMVKNDDKVDEILNAAVDMESSIDDTLTMILNSYL